jgi:hypothetical protein
MRLKNEVQELKILERVIKTENESLRVHNLRMLDENDSLRDENEQLKKENVLLEKQVYKWFKQKKKLRLQNQNLQVKVLMHRPRRQMRKRGRTTDQRIEIKSRKLTILSKCFHHMVISMPKSTFTSRPIIFFVAHTPPF